MNYSPVGGPSRSPTSTTSQRERERQRQRTTSGPAHSKSVNDGKKSLWTEILDSADRQKSLGRKNIILLSERHHGRTHLLSQLSSTSNNKRKNRPNRGVTAGGTGATGTTTASQTGRSKALALGYQVIDVGDGDEDSVPPLSVFYPPSSHPSLLSLVPNALPPNSLSDTAVVIVLDWTKPSSMVKELVTWLSWVDNWASTSAQRGETEELREKLQSYLQHYTEPSSTLAAGSTAFAGVGPLLPLGPGTLTLNKSGIPIVVVCTKADLMDSVRDEVGIKGAGWEERTDWIQQVIRTICLAYGAALFYTASTQPTTYTHLRTYLLHRLYTIPPPLHPQTNSSDTTNAAAHVGSARFPFPHRVNVLDRDAVMVLSGWDSWGKINVLREGFDPSRIEKAWQVSLSQNEEDDQAEGESLEDIWVEMVPDTERGARAPNSHGMTTTTEPEQSFLSRQLDILLKDPNRDPRQSFRHAAATVVGPLMGGSEGLSLPGVEKAMAAMEGGDGRAEELKEKFARLGRKDPSKTGPLSPTGTGATPHATPVAMPNEALHNFFQGLLANRANTGATPGTPTPATASAQSGGGNSG